MRDSVSFLLSFLIRRLLLFLLVYGVGCLPPLSFVGRLATGRLIVPGYGQVFVAPLLAAAVGLTWLIDFFGTSINPAVYLSFDAAITLFIILAMGPGVEKWRLTGHHRIGPAQARQVRMVGRIK